MYGYVFGAAHLNISHKWDEISMIYPGYMPQGGWLPAERSTRLDGGADSAPYLMLPC